MWIIKYCVKNTSSKAVDVTIAGSLFNAVGFDGVTMNPAEKINRENFKVFWSTGMAWGTYSRRIDSITKKVENDIKVLYGDLEGVKVFVDNQLVASF